MAKLSSKSLLNFSTLILLLVTTTATPNTAIATVKGAKVVVGSASWCVARSEASNGALQIGMDYACSVGADCAPIQSNGLCFLPNTFQAHASYAYNSFFQKKSMVPGSCDFSGTATIAKTDPSYGACVYPSSLSNAGGPIMQATPTTTSSGSTVAPPQFNGTGTGGFSPGYGGFPPGNGGFTPATGIFPPPGTDTGITTTVDSKASLGLPVCTILMTIQVLFALLFT